MIFSVRTLVIIRAFHPLSFRKEILSMNIFKINSQGLIKSDNTEDVFNSIIGGDEGRIFDLQRFDDPPTVKLTSGR